MTASVGPTTLRLLKRLAVARGRPVSVEALLFAAYGDDEAGGPEDAKNTLRVLILRLRRRLPSGTIRTHWGFGYSLDRESEVARTLAAVDEAMVVLAVTEADRQAVLNAMGR